jgi:hypothetical protein
MYTKSFRTRLPSAVTSFWTGQISKENTKGDKVKIDQQIGFLEERLA